MLYIFLVNTGTMMTFEMSFALDTVENLKWAIFNKYQIPVNYQVLLISGGESLNPDDRVCHYSSAGTDTSPIFLFCKNQVELSLDVSYAVADSDDDMKDRVESCLQMEPNFNTVVSRNEMAKQLYETDRLLYHKCEKLVHDQHLQQQSWAAVVANLEDIVASFKNKAKKVEYLYADILKNKSSYLCLLESFNRDKQILSKIPILKCLVPKTENLEADISLLEWITKKDSNNSLDELYCLEELNDYDQEKLKNIKNNVESVLSDCTNFDMKEIKGLEQRLSALEKLICEAKNIYERQGILTQGFNQNQTRISDLRDPTILPDLCQNHREQLQSMLLNHIELIDLKNKCLFAKRELSQNLNQRLRWIIHVQEQLKNVDETVVVIGIKLQKLRTKLEIVQSLHTSPKVYFDSIVEVLRRKIFSDMFYNWAENISKIAKQLVDKEVNARRLFSEKLENHFLKCFFPGMNDYPQNFITETTRIDQFLPQISFDDIRLLKNTLPEMSNHLVVPSIVPASFIDLNTNEVDLSSVQQKEDEYTSTLLSLEDIEYLESTKSDMQKFLSEKNEIIQDLSDKLNTFQEHDDKIMNVLNRYRSTFVDLIGLINFLKANFNIQLLSYVQNFSRDLKNLSLQFEQIENSTNQLKKSSSQDKRMISELYDKINYLEEELRKKNSELDISYQELSEERNKNEKYRKDIREKATKLRTLKILIQKEDSILKEFKSIFQNCNSALTNYQNEFILLYNELNDKGLLSYKEKVGLFIKHLDEKYEQDLECFKKKISLEKDQENQKLRDQLNFDHKNELESLRHRFKLAISTTSIERTSSETSLEKVQLDIIDQSAQEKEIQKLKSMFIDQKNEHEQQIAILKSEHENFIKTLKCDFEKEKKLISESLKKKIVSNENEMNVDFLLQKISIYENFLSHINGRLSNNQSKSEDTIMALSQDLNDLNRNVELLNSRSFISIPTTPDSPKLIRNLGHFNVDYVNIYSNIDDKITAYSCEIGDIVLVYYEKKLENFIVFTMLDNLYYIHSDSLKECDISKDPVTNEYYWIVAKVTEKEYCQIKKEINRYKLPLNTKFYRVKIQQISKCLQLQTN